MHKYRIEPVPEDWPPRSHTALYGKGSIKEANLPKLFHAFAEETGALTQEVKDDIVECCKTVVRMEDKFIDRTLQLVAEDKDD